MTVAGVDRQAAVVAVEEIAVVLQLGVGLRNEEEESLSWQQPPVAGQIFLPADC